MWARGRLFNSSVGAISESRLLTMVNLRINWTLYIGAVGRETPQQKHRTYRGRVNVYLFFRFTINAFGLRAMV